METINKSSQKKIEAPLVPVDFTAENLPGHLKAEEENALFDFSKRVSLAKINLSDSARKAILDPVVKEERLHTETLKNFIAFSMLGSILNPEYGSLGFLPQYSPEWLAFRRLALAISDLEIPESLKLRTKFQSMSKVSIKGETAESPPPSQDLTEIHNSNRGDSDGEPSTENEDNPRPCKSEASSSEYPPLFKSVTKIRLDRYSTISLESARKEFIERGWCDLDRGSGALFKIVGHPVVDSLPGHVPSLVSFPEEKWDTKSDHRHPTTLHLLRDAISEINTEMDLEAEYREAASSMRAVIFDIAVEAVLGKVAKKMNAYEIVGHYLDQSFLDDPSILDRDNWGRHYFIRNVAAYGSQYLFQLARLSQTREKNDSPSKVDRLRHFLAITWVDADWPLWVMSTEAITTLLRHVFPTDTITPDKIKEVTKGRKNSSRSNLRRSSKQLITGIRIEKNGTEDVGYPSFVGYLERSSHIQELKSHIASLPLPFAEF